jgi:hypothetical protein
MRINIPEEWAAFQEHARKFPDNPPETRYGIINPSTYDTMLYADCPRKLHDLHYDNWPPVALRDQLDWLETIEGKRSKGISSVIR